MDITEYPRPLRDTGVGFHWFPDERHYDKSVLDVFLPRLTAMGTSWLVLPSTLDRPVPEYFVKSLLGASIEPVIKITTAYICPVNQRHLRRLCETYAHWGVHYMLIFDQPNLVRQWGPAQQVGGQEGCPPNPHPSSPKIGRGGRGERGQAKPQEREGGGEGIPLVGAQCIAPLPSFPLRKPERKQWDASNLPDHFMDYLLPCLETMFTVNDIVPVFTPLAPEGDYHDLEFLKKCLDIINSRGKDYLYSKLAIGIHNYAGNKPLTWGKGGQASWPCAQPYRCPPGCENHCGFYMFEWYDEIVRERVGHSLPLICAGNGVLVGCHEHDYYPAIDQALHAKRSLKMSQMLMHGQVPAYIFNNAFWVLSAEHGNELAKHRWYTPDGKPVLPQSIAMLEDMPKQERPPAIGAPKSLRVLMADNKVVTMDIEEYVKGVVPQEMGSGKPLEALKAQAIAARSYAAAAVRHPRHGGAAVCTTTHCQVWSPRRYQDTDQAVNETKGAVVTYNGEIVSTYYFGHCDGHTRNSEDVWRRALPYCRSVPCICGYKTMYGHGIGMCQRGAIAMAEQGATCEEIIKYYYTGVTIVGSVSSP